MRHALRLEFSLESDLTREKVTPEVSSHRNKAVMWTGEMLLGSLFRVFQVIHCTTSPGNIHTHSHSPLLNVMCRTGRERGLEESGHMCIMAKSLGCSPETITTLFIV